MDRLVTVQRARRVNTQLDMRKEVAERGQPPMAEGFSIQSEKQLWKRFLTVEDRLVRYPDGRENAFDILGSPKIEYKVRAP